MCVEYAPPASPSTNVQGGLVSTLLKVATFTKPPSEPVSVCSVFKTWKKKKKKSQRHSGVSYSCIFIVLYYGDWVSILGDWGPLTSHISRKKLWKILSDREKRNRILSITKIKQREKVTTRVQFVLYFTYTWRGVCVCLTQAASLSGF